MDNYDVALRMRTFLGGDKSILGNHSSAATHVSLPVNEIWVEDLWSQVFSSLSLLIITKQLSVVALLFVCAINGIVITLKTLLI